MALAPPPPDPATIFDVLADPECRRILLALDEPMTAGEAVDATGIPPSTLYRKLAELEEAGLLARSHRLTAVGRHPRQYERRFDRLSVGLDVAAASGFDVSLEFDDGRQHRAERLRSPQ